VSAALAISEPRRTELDDVTLVRAQQGDTAAFRALIELYQDAVFALLWRFYGRAARADLVEDIAQETFLGVYRSIARFRADGPARLSTWILTIASRSAIKAVRRDAPPTLPIDEVVDTLPAAESTSTGFANALGRALVALAEPYRIVFLLRAYHDFSYEDIAEALDVDLGTVKSRLARARSQLQVALKEFEP
jgi:RNA polymerase sigma-70 factor (ECF subfamily)